MRLPRFRLPTRQGRIRAGAALIVLAVVIAVIAVVTGDDEERPIATDDVTMTLPESPGSAATVDIDARLYRPETTPAPAVLLAHGFGGSKESTDSQAGALARDGFAVLTYSARGFGKSTGSISLNDPDREVADARGLVDWLAQRPEVQLDAPGDPRIGVTGGSYGGALALMLGGTDKRIDAIAAGITWNDLGQALYPNYGTTGAQPPTPGVLKRGWAGIFFGVGSAPTTPGQSSGDLQTDICGRFVLAFCQSYVQSTLTGAPAPELLALLRAHSPASVAQNITAPTLLAQGERDTLFGLDQADANAREIAAGGAPVTVRWFNGGHDGDADRGDSTMRSFLRDRLLNRDSKPSSEPSAFDYALPGSLDEQGQTPSRRIRADAYPGLRDTGETPHTTVGFTEWSAPDQTIARPPGASPSAVSNVPGLGAAASALSAAAGGGGITLDPPGQTATFRTAPLDHAVTITGSSTVNIRVQSFAAPGETVLFAKLYDVGSTGRRTLPGGAISPVRLPDANGAPVDVRVALPAIAYQVPEGHRIELAIGTTDQSYSVPLSPARFTVSLASTELTVPSITGNPTRRSVPIGPLVGIGAIAGCLLLLVAGATVVSRRRGIADADPELLDVPIVVSDLSKTYDNGFTAVDRVGFRVEHGQVLGLLGPNGAGKTTTLRMLMGLITPTAGEIRVFGHRITPGAPVLSRLGAFIEGPGLLPHLSGADNLRLFWQATGRPPEDASLDDVLAIADLGTAIDRKVRSYSQGMRQRLAIAQAMLGMPDLLILDEPTNGLDPPQIRTMRDVLIEYARGGRTVVVSSHLLAEVEQTCTHVVVMDRGKVISSGTVADLVAAGSPTEIRVDDVDAAVAALADVDGIGHVLTTRGEQPTVRVDLGTASTATVVKALVDASVAVNGMSATTRLEDVFLALVHDPRAVDTSDEVIT